MILLDHTYHRRRHPCVMRALSMEADRSPLVKVETGLGCEPFSFARIYCANEIYTWHRQPSCPLVQDRKIYIYIKMIFSASSWSRSVARASGSFSQPWRFWTTSLLSIYYWSRSSISRCNRPHVYINRTWPSVQTRLGFTSQVPWHLRPGKEGTRGLWLLK